MLQETKVRRLNLVKTLGSTNSLPAVNKNCVDKHLSGGLMTTATNNLILIKDQHNTSEFILVSNLLIETGKDQNDVRRSGHVKLINVYFQPNHK